MEKTDKPKQKKKPFPQKLPTLGSNLPGMVAYRVYIPKDIADRITKDLPKSDKFDAGATFIQQLFREDNISPILESITKTDGEIRDMLEKFAVTHNITLK